MPLPDLQILQSDLKAAQRRLTESEKAFGKESDQYQSALRHFTQMWVMVKMSRHKEEFINDPALAALKGKTVSSDLA